MTKISKPKIIVILGPTACGKTKLAVRLADIFNGEIISADSRQVYQGMDIGTGKDLKEYKNVPYHLIDVTNPKKQFSLAQYQKLAYRAIDGVLKRKKVPFLVGGTGLYLQSIIDGYQLVNVKTDKKLREQLYKKGLKQLQAQVHKLKIKLNRSDFNNKRRLVRVIEKANNESRFVIRDSRIANTESRIAKYDCLILGIKFDKNIINNRIDKRLKQRLGKENLIGEVRKLHRQGVSWKRLEDFGLEYKWIALYLQKKISYEEMVEKLKIAIHQFAKRQMTWFKRMENIHCSKNFPEANKLINNFIK